MHDNEDRFRLVGRILDGKYRIDSVAGEGGFSIVYRATHTNLLHAVAVKCLLVPPFVGRDARQKFFQRFYDEGRVLTMLDQHPGIVRVLDLGIATGSQVPYLVLEWLDGVSLDTALEAVGRPLSEQKTLMLMRPVAEAMALAHRMGIVHRDLKPSNLFLAQTVRGPVVKILDFGISKVMETDPTALMADTSRLSTFSPGYAAPEQFRSKIWGPSGPWTDVHAFGLLLVEIVFGRPAIRSEDTAGFYEASVADTRPTPRALGVDVTEVSNSCVLARWQELLRTGFAMPSSCARRSTRCWRCRALCRRASVSTWRRAQRREPRKRPPPWVNPWLW